MDFKNERLMMTEEEARNRAKELLNENQVDLITKYMFLEQQCKKQKEVIDKLNNKINSLITCEDKPKEDIIYPHWEICNETKQEMLDILKEVPK